MYSSRQLEAVNILPEERAVHDEAVTEAPATVWSPNIAPVQTCSEVTLLRRKLRLLEPGGGTP